MTFQTGASGNPTGRPKGSGSRQRLFNNIVAPHQEALLDTAIKLALGGNEAMLRIFLERLLPSKMVDESLDIEGTARESISMILAYVAAGDMTADEARKIASIIQKDAEINNQEIHNE